MLRFFRYRLNDEAEETSSDVDALQEKPNCRRNKKKFNKYFNGK
jgi:hypothetical protein